MLHQWIIFRTALMFLTRIPVGRLPFSQANLQASARYFSWVGILVGLVSAMVCIVANYLFSMPLSIAISMMASILLTGAFHEDGWADCCDAFGGGWTKEKILTIMKDSRLGTYGVVGLIGMLAIKFLLLLEISNNTSAILLGMVMITAHSSSRFFAVTIMQKLPYVQDIDSSKSKPLANRKLTKIEMGVLLIGMAIPLIVLSQISTDYRLPFTVYHLPSTVYFLLLLPCYIFCIFARRYFKKWIGGYTGDCLGATQQITELIFYLGFLLLWKFI
ncbi:MAG: adenosylcobinamide-GDP ribazoletransferase [Sphingobacteriia bacterium]|nr:MAG: adenosylcobinamide-GDP ribazoletransferase [Sphingobacteriia bacterium]